MGLLLAFMNETVKQTCSWLTYFTLLFLPQDRVCKVIFNPLSANHNSCLPCHLLVILKVIFANSVDPDQTAPLGAVWSGSKLFACMQK